MGVGQVGSKETHQHISIPKKAELSCGEKSIKVNSLVLRALIDNQIVDYVNGRFLVKKEYQEGIITASESGAFGKKVLDEKEAMAVIEKILYTRPAYPQGQDISGTMEDLLKMRRESPFVDRRTFAGMKWIKMVAQENGRFIGFENSAAFHDALKSVGIIKNDGTVDREALEKNWGLFKKRGVSQFFYDFLAEKARRALSPEKFDREKYEALENKLGVSKAKSDAFIYTFPSFRIANF
jgi:hypothetical protein